MSNNTAYAHLGNIVFSGKLLLRYSALCVAFPYLRSLFVGKFGACGLLPVRQEFGVSARPVRFTARAFFGVLSRAVIIPVSIAMLGVAVGRVFGLSSQPQMLGSTARPHVATVKDAQLIGDGADVERIGEAVSHSGPPANLKDAVAVAVRRTFPKPAGFRLFDVRPEKNFGVARLFLRTTPLATKASPSLCDIVNGCEELSSARLAYSWYSFSSHAANVSIIRGVVRLVRCSNSVRAILLNAKYSTETVI